MLIELQCTEFKSNKQPRSVIKFNSGLNTVLGDNVGSNSIGKSTFLMIIDFVFGGEDYIKKSEDVQRQIEEHTIQFTFKFKNQFHYFSRNTLTHNRVNKCNSEYKFETDMSIDEFRKLLLKEYAISLPSITFRDIVGRYFRIYKRENLDENRPLHSVPSEKAEQSIISLIKLFNMYTNIEKLQTKLKEAEDKKVVFNKMIRYNFIPKVTSAQLKKNRSEIFELTTRLENISNHQNTEEQKFLSNLASEDAERLLMTKKELTSLRQQKSRLETKLAYIQGNLEKDKYKLQDDFSELEVFFPSVNIQKIQEIETFHSKLQGILEIEFRDEQQKTEILLNQIEEGINEHRKIIDEEGMPNRISKKILEEYHSIKKQIEQLENQESKHTQQEELKESIKTIGEQLKDRLSNQLRELQNTITRKMEDLNNFIYDGQKKAPILTLESVKKYIFETPDDTGTGTSYKGLVVFDLSILALTPLPALVHDSVVLKQIADEPLEKILELYQKSGKQIFIALDKASSYSKRTNQILEQSAVLRLSDNGNELFGRSWNKTE